jgi:hypothetical protein
MLLYSTLLKVMTRCQGLLKRSHACCVSGFSSYLLGKSANKIKGGQPQFNAGVGVRRFTYNFNWIMQ